MLQHARSYYVIWCSVLYGIVRGRGLVVVSAQISGFRSHVLLEHLLDIFPLLIVTALPVQGFGHRKLQVQKAQAWW